MNINRLLLCSVLSLGATAAYAQAPAITLDETIYQKLDTNQDGKVSREEYRVFMEQAFDKLDTDKSGSLNRAETAPVFTDSEFVIVDTNKDGVISREEFMTQVLNDFQLQDRNGDGFLVR